MPFNGFDENVWKEDSLLVALNTLAMGDSPAVEIAQAAHTEILQRSYGPE